MKTTYTVFNHTDGIPAHHEGFDTRKEAEKWIVGFRKNMNDIQGYYLTSDRERIPLSEVQLTVERIDEETEHEKCDKCGGPADEFVCCHDESKKHKSCGAVWCLPCYNSNDGWYYEDEDAFPGADDILIHTDLCPRCVTSASAPK